MSGTGSSGKLPPLHESDDEEVEDVLPQPQTPPDTPRRKRVSFTSFLRKSNGPRGSQQSNDPIPPPPQTRRAVSDPTDYRPERRKSKFRGAMSTYFASFKHRHSSDESFLDAERPPHQARSVFRRRQQLRGQGRGSHSRRSADRLQSRATYVRYRVGDSVLVNCDQSRWATLVNRYGYPPGQGVTPEEQRGPYLYVLATVKKVHFEEDAEYYTVTRCDTDADQRANAEWMEPIRTARGEAAALRAARERSGAEDFDQELADGLHDTDSFKDMNTFVIALNVIVMPFLWIYDFMYDWVLHPVARLGTRVYSFVQSQAKLFLNGVPPYALSFRFTMVNCLVLCSIWYMFIDQARLAFFEPNADSSLAVVSFIVWSILVMELVFEVFIRPEGYSSLIDSDKAFTPTTARFLNSFHLFFETISLAVFVPEFLCLWTSTYSCDDRPSFSFFNACLSAVLGPTRSDAFYGRAYMALVRLRVFGLVRHWKKMWLNNTYVTMKWKSQAGTAKEYLLRHISLSRQESLPKNVAEEQKERDWSLVHASNIGTALMVSNSHRALLLLWFIMGIYPLLYAMDVDRINSVATELVWQLEALNAQLNNSSDPGECFFFIDSVASWIVGVTTGNTAGFGNDGLDIFLLYLEIEPLRCGLETPVFTQGLCSLIDPTELEPDEAELINGMCAVWNATYAGISDEGLADLAGIRTGSVYTIATKPTFGNFTELNGTLVEDVKFSVVAKFNENIVVRPAASLSFFLQIALLISVLGGLSILRRDAAVLVLSPLRRMLKIVARYAKNPLATTSADTSEDADSDGDSDAGPTTIIGNYETEQLITAISKIADLLRKCWGVAGADIISTNLDTKEGALADVFNPTVPGKSVYALFGFAAIQHFDHILRNLGDDVMKLINNVAAVLHSEVFRWGFGDSGQCNKNLGGAFLMVYRIGLVKEVIQKLEQATDVVFSNTSKQKPGVRPRRLDQTRKTDSKSQLRTARTGAAERRQRRAHARKGVNAMSLSLQSLPGISAFTDRAVIGMLKSFAGVYRDGKLNLWNKDFRLGAGVGAFSIDLIFGMDAGWAQEGAVGSSFKIDATYLSPHVNMASRMMSACKQYGVSMLLSQAVEELMSDTARSKLRHLDTVTVKGSSLKQKIFTYDARHKGVDFFLFERTDDQADIDSEQYSPAIWLADQDLKAMREHMSDDFESEFNKGRNAYLAGDWETAVKHLERADEIMVENVREMGYLEADLDDVHDGDVHVAELERKEMEDGPTRCLLNYIAKEGGRAPDSWKGYRPLVNK